MEYVSLSQDSGHEDLRQRRELNNNSSILIDQAAVRAAIHGRVLLLEGIDRVERNILPLLNNLLENREITLDDGRLLLPNNRVNKLNDQKGEGGIALESVHDQFRVIGIMRVNAKDSDNSIQAKLDPPLRSRFQARYISSLSATSLLAILQSLAPTVHSNSPAILTNYIKLYNSVLSFKSGIYFLFSLFSASTLPLNSFRPTSPFFPFPRPTQSYSSPSVPLIHSL